MYSHTFFVRMKVPSKVEGKTLNKKMRGKGHFRDAPKLPQSTYSGTACTQNPLPILTSGSTYSKMSERKAVIKNADMSEVCAPLSRCEFRAGEQLRAAFGNIPPIFSTRVRLPTTRSDSLQRIVSASYFLTSSLHRLDRTCSRMRLTVRPR